ENAFAVFHLEARSETNATDLKTPLVLDLDSLLQVVTAGLKTDLRVASRRDRIEDGLHVVTGMDHESALTRFIAAAQVIECFLNVLCLAEVADGVVETD